MIHIQSTCHEIFFHESELHWSAAPGDRAAHAVETDGVVPGADVHDHDRFFYPFVQERTTLLTRITRKEKKRLGPVKSSRSKR